MRRHLGVVVAVLAFLGVLVAPSLVLAQAPAPKVTIDGFVDNRLLHDRNVSIADTDITRRRDAETIGQIRAQLRITGEVGKTKLVSQWQYDLSFGSVSGDLAGLHLDAGPSGIGDRRIVGSRDVAGRFGSTAGGVLDAEQTGVLALRDLYLQFQLTGPDSLLPFVPVNGVAMVGQNPAPDDLNEWKPATLFWNWYTGVHIDLDLMPGLKFGGTYAQLTDSSFGKQFFANPQGDDFAVIGTLTFSPYKGLDLKPVYAYLFLNGGAIPATFGTPRPGQGGVSDDRTFFPLGAAEDRHTIGAQARWRYGPWELLPTVYYQFGDREIVPTVFNNSETSNCGGVRCVDQDFDSWYFDVQGGWKSGPLTIDGLFVYTSGNKAEEDLRSGRTIHYYVPISTDEVYNIGWGTITAIDLDYNTQLFESAQGLAPTVQPSYDKYGRIQIGLRAGYALTPAFTLRALATALWTAEDVDTHGSTSAANGAAGLASLRTGATSRGHQSYLGTETDIGFDWNFAPNVTFTAVLGHLFVGDAFNAANGQPTGIITPRDAKDVEYFGTRLRYAF